MESVISFLQHHLTAAGFGGGALIVATISAMPKYRPRTFDDWWEWLRDALQTAIPASRRQHEQETQPKQENSDVQTGK